MKYIRLFVFLLFIMYVSTVIAEDQEKNTLYFVAIDFPQEMLSLFKLDGTIVQFQIPETYDGVSTISRVEHDSFMISLLNSGTQSFGDYFVSVESGLRKIEYPVPPGTVSSYGFASDVAFPYIASIVIYDDDNIYNTISTAALVLYDLRTGASEVLTTYIDEGPVDCCSFSEDGQYLRYLRVDNVEITQDRRIVDFAFVERDLFTGNERIIRQQMANYPLELPEQVDYRESLDLLADQEDTIWLESLIQEDEIIFTVFDLNGDVLWQNTLAINGDCQPFVFLRLGDIWQYYSNVGIGSGEGCDTSSLWRYREFETDPRYYSMQDVHTFGSSRGLGILELNETEILIDSSNYFILTESSSKDTAVHPQVIGDTSRALRRSEHRSVSLDSRYVFVADDVDSTDFRMIEISTGETIWEGEGGNASPVYFDTLRYMRMLRVNYTVNFSTNTLENVSVGAFVRDGDTGEVYELPIIDAQDDPTTYYGRVFEDGTMLISRNGDIYLHHLADRSDNLIAEDVGTLSEILGD